MLDLCCGDSFVLKYVGDYIDEYVGVDNNEKYLKSLRKDWPKFSFLKADISNLDNLIEIKNFYPNLIFMNGAIHHLDDEMVRSNRQASMCMIVGFVALHYVQCCVQIANTAFRYKASCLLIRMHDSKL